eukprot:CAMPEP_0116572288 /NCGR_PEP_ID=MMETSP0397-20121206/18084_1 /TAXON_ID=216820 /ORGANISM="Cyclophora tenuis, Strain ECT3854" /LENGTH=74 /DNA_ID=CAMNT_0004100583 /DNA_START=310 /DNA_END=530 /DNA_ORIENTATION=-
MEFHRSLPGTGSSPEQYRPRLAPSVGSQRNGLLLANWSDVVDCQRFSTADIAVLAAEPETMSFAPPSEWCESLV